MLSVGPTSSLATKCARYCALKDLLAPEEPEEGQDATWTRFNEIARDIIGTQCNSLAECVLKIEVMLDWVDEADQETRHMLQSLHRDLSELPHALSS